jgi:transketolase
MRFTTTAPASTLTALSTVSSVEIVETIENLTIFTVNPQEAPTVLRTLIGLGAKVEAGSPRAHGTPMLPRGIPATSAIVRRG